MEDFKIRDISWNTLAKFLSYNLYIPRREKWIFIDSDMLDLCGEDGSKDSSQLSKVG